jgi:hypothetical protein
VTNQLEATGKGLQQQQPTHKGSRFINLGEFDTHFEIGFFFVIPLVYFVLFHLIFIFFRYRFANKLRSPPPPT